MTKPTTKPHSRFKSALRCLYFGLLYLLPAVLFFSYYPIIPLGSSASMNFELSLPLIWLILFDIIAFISLLVHHFSSKKSQPVTSSKEKNSPTSRQQSSFHETKSEAKLASQNDSPVKTGAGVGLLKRTTVGEFVGISDRRFFLFSLFPFFATLSVFWSANPLRALLTAGIIWLLFFAIFAILYITPLLSPPSNLKPRLLAIFFISTAAVCLFCFLQSILDVCGVPRSDTLLCAGCTYRAFGFPHPSGFAIEPQFMGNLLLAPTLLSLYLLTFSPTNHEEESKGTTKKPNRQNLTAHFEKTRAHQASQSSFSASSREEQAATTERAPRKDGRANGMPKRMTGWLVRACAFLFSLTLFFTFSRGAIYAYALALFILLIFAIARKRRLARLILIPVLSFLCALGLQGTFAALGPTSETFTSAVTKSIHQLSLGLIDLRPNQSSSETSQQSSEPSQISSETPPSEAQSPKTTPVASLDTLEAPSNSNPPTKALAENSSSVSPDTSNGESSDSTSSETPTFDGYIAESTNIRLNLNSAAFRTWLSAPGHPRSSLEIGFSCQEFFRLCALHASLTPTSILFGVGLGGAGTALSRNSFFTGITTPKEIVQNQYFSLLLELGLVGLALAVFTLLIAFFPSLFSPKFLDGRAAKPLTTPVTSSKSPKKASKNASKAPSATQTCGKPCGKVCAKSCGKLFQSPFWHHPALPLLLSLIVAYLITLNFFSGLPNALHIYLLPPLLYLIFSQPPAASTAKS